MISLVRTLLSQVVEGAIKRFSGSGRPGELFSSREYLQHYGFTSRPKAGAEGLVLVDGNTIYLIASDDRRYRISLQDGEVALYSDEGDFIHFKRNKLLHVSTGRKLQADAAAEAEITAPVTKVTSSTSCTITAPTIQLTGAVHVTGTIAATGTISAPTLASQGATMGASISTSGSISASGSIMDGTGNSNHHSHG
jgi:phage baseplate assembly protein V